jgi:uncharacterized membrane protein YeaQ/YmgE (transglycosylase-associated protein family)
MLDHLIQMGPMLLLAGVMAGWVAEAASRAGGHGFLVDMAVGLIGSAAVGGALWAVIATDAGGMVAMFLIGSAGAAGAIVAQRVLWPSASLGM